MNTTNALLGAIDLWLRERGYKSCLNLSYAAGRACLGGTPNITITLPGSGALLRVEAQALQLTKVAYDPASGRITYGRAAKLELSDPDLFERLTALLEEAGPR